MRRVPICGLRQVLKVWKFAKSKRETQHHKWILIWDEWRGTWWQFQDEKLTSKSKENCPWQHIAYTETQWLNLDHSYPNRSYHKIVILAWMMPVAIASAIASCNFVSSHNESLSVVAVVSIEVKVLTVAVVTNESPSKFDREHWLADF